MYGYCHVANSKIPKKSFRKLLKKHRKNVAYILCSTYVVSKIQSKHKNCFIEFIYRLFSPFLIDHISPESISKKRDWLHFQLPITAAGRVTGVLPKLLFFLKYFSFVHLAASMQESSEIRLARKWLELLMHFLKFAFKVWVK